MGCGPTTPLIVNTIGSPTLVVTVIVFVNGPTRFVSYFTEILDDFPGATGSVGFSAVVHPQLVATFVTITGVFPVFLNSNVNVSSAP